MNITEISSRDNAFVKELRRLSRESGMYRKLGHVWLEGDHLCRAALTRGLTPKVAVFLSLLAFSARGMGASS